MLLKTLFRLLHPGNILDPLGILGIGKGSQVRPQQQPSLAPGSTVQQQHTSDGASQPVKPKNNAAVGSSGNANAALTSNNGIVPPGVSKIDGSTSIGDAIINIPDKLGGTTDGTKHPLEPGEIEEGQNDTNGQYPGVGVQSPPEQGSVPSEPSQLTENLSDTGKPLIAEEARSSKPLEILKSIVYGGLMESITSLSIVSSAAASDATTSNIVALGLANLIGGLIVLLHNLKDLIYLESNEANEGVKSRYQELLGCKENFILHAIFAVLSYLVFGLIPPAVYGFTFRGTDDSDFKLLAAATSALVFIVILALAKAYARGEDKFMSYPKTALYYITAAVMVSGIAYAIGHFFKKLVDRLAWFDQDPVKHLLIPESKTWASF